MKTIEIDLDIHKLLEQARREFSEPENSILRRLLELDGEPSAPPHDLPNGSEQPRPWRGRNIKLNKIIEVPHGEKIFGIYNHKQIEGIVKDGKIEVNGKVFDSLSPAAIANLETKSGNKTALNGWKVWHRKVGGRLIRMIDL